MLVQTSNGLQVIPSAEEVNTFFGYEPEASDLAPYHIETETVVHKSGLIVEVVRIVYE